MFVMVFSVGFAGCAPPEDEPTPTPTPVEEAEDVNDNEWVDITVSVGEEIPSAEEAGADYIEPEERETIEESSWLTFGERWNEASENVGKPELSLDEVEVRYAKPNMSFDYEIAPYLFIFGSICYETKELEYTGVDWEITPEIDGETITSSWSALIYATNPDITSEELYDIMMELNIYELTEEEIADYEQIITIGDLEYDFYSTDTWGEFTITPVEE